MTNIVVLGKDWAIVEDVVDDSLWLDIDLPDAVFTANQDGVEIRLPAVVLDAIRGLKPKQVPHLRRARKEVFSERSKKGWVTRRSEDRLENDNGLSLSCGEGDPVVA